MVSEAISKIVKSCFLKGFQFYLEYKIGEGRMTIFRKQEKKNLVESLVYIHNPKHALF